MTLYPDYNTLLPAPTPEGWRGRRRGRKESLLLCFFSYTFNCVFLRSADTKGEATLSDGIT